MFNTISRAKVLSETAQKFKNQVERAMFSCNLSLTRLLWKARYGLLRALPSTRLANVHVAKSWSLFCLSQHEN